MEPPEVYYNYRKDIFLSSAKRPISFESVVGITYSVSFGKSGGCVWISDPGVEEPIVLRVCTHANTFRVLVQNTFKVCNH